MDELISRSFKARASEAEEERLLAWRRASPRNEAYHRDLLRLLELAESTAPVTDVPAPPPVRKLVARAARGAPAARGSGGWLWAGVGAMATAAAIAMLMLGLHRPAAAPDFSLGTGEFVTGVAETATMVLADGTVVRLAPESRLRLPGGSGNRDVILDGRAYFAVAKREDYPFRVLTRAGEAVALGTRFEVRTHGEELRLVVLEGRVALGAQGQRVEVGAGEMSLVSEGTTAPPVRLQDVRPLVSWLDRFIVLQGTPLREAARELEAEYGVRIEIADSALAQQTVTGWYADRSFEEVLTIVCGVLQASCSIQDGIARIEP